MSDASPVELSTLTLVKVQNDEQAAQCDAETFQQWLAPRGATPGHLEAAAAALRTPTAVPEQVWVLVPREDLGTVRPLAHCETYCRSGVVRTPDGGQRDVVSYAVGAVLTPPEHRKKGYGTHMMRLMHYVLAPRDALPPFPAEWGEPPPETYGDAAFSVLYSDVGTTFYAKATQGITRPGWVAGWDRAPHRLWTMDETINTEHQDIVLPDGWEWLDDTTVVPLEDKASAWMRREVRNIGDPSRTRVFCPPEQGWLRFGWTRERLFSEAADLIVPQDRLIGVRLSAADDAPFFTFAIVDEAPHPRQLIINFVYKPELIPFTIVRTCAHRIGASQIALWGGYAGWDKEEARMTLKLDYLTPCIAQYGLADKDEDLQWVWCEHYLFC